MSARVDWSGVGIDLRSNRPTPSQVRDAVRRVLAEPSFRQRSTAIGQDIIASPGLDGLEAVLAQVIARGAGAR